MISSCSCLVEARSSHRYLTLSFTAVAVSDEGSGAEIALLNVFALEPELYVARRLGLAASAILLDGSRLGPGAGLESFGRLCEMEGIPCLLHNVVYGVME